MKATDPRPSAPFGRAVATAALAATLAAGVPAIAEDVAARPEPGTAALDFTLPDLDGAPHTLGEGLEDGPMVVVFFRGAW